MFEFTDSSSDSWVNQVSQQTGFPVEAIQAFIIQGTGDEVFQEVFSVILEMLDTFVRLMRTVEYLSGVSRANGSQLKSGLINVDLELKQYFADLEEILLEFAHKSGIDSSDITSLFDDNRERIEVLAKAIITSRSTGEPDTLIEELSTFKMALERLSLRFTPAKGGNTNQKDNDAAYNLIQQHKSLNPDKTISWVKTDQNIINHLMSISRDSMTDDEKLFFDRWFFDWNKPRLPDKDRRKNLKNVHFTRLRQQRQANNPASDNN